MQMLRHRHTELVDLRGFGCVLMLGGTVRRRAPVSGTYLFFIFFFLAELLIPGRGSGSRLDRLIRATHIFVLLVQRLKQGFGGGKNRFIVRKRGGKGRIRLSTSFRGNLDSGMRGRRCLYNWLLVALVFGNRLSGQQDGLVTSRRPGRAWRRALGRTSKAFLRLFVSFRSIGSFRAAVASITPSPAAAPATTPATVF